MVHVGPPRLLAEERGADAATERGAREIMVGIGVVRVGVENGVRDTLHHVLVGYFA